MGSATSPKPELVRTIRLDNTRVETLLDHLDNLGGQPETEQRASERYRYRVKGCIVHLQQPGDGCSTPYLVPTRDISAGGLAFLHGGFVHTGTRCLIQLITAGGAWQNMPGVVVRCRYAEDGVHEVAIRFDSEIEPEDYCKEA